MMVRTPLPLVVGDRRHRANHTNAAHDFTQFKAELGPAIESLRDDNYMPPFIPLFVYTGSVKDVKGDSDFKRVLAEISKNAREVWGSDRDEQQESTYFPVEYAVVADYRQEDDW